MSGEAAPTAPAIHLWNPIVGTELVATIGDGPVEVHLPISLAAGVAAECGANRAGMFLALLVHASLHHAAESGAVPDVPDVADQLAAIISDQEWCGSIDREVMFASTSVGQGRTVEAIVPHPLKEIEIPPIEPEGGVRDEHLRTPRRFADRLPVIVVKSVMRLGHRNGKWQGRGFDVAGTVVDVASGAHAGWPLTVVLGGASVTTVEVEWGLEDRSAGGLSKMTLRAVPPDAAKSGSPEDIFLKSLPGAELARPPVAAPPSAPESPEPSTAESQHDELETGAEQLYETPRVVVTAGKTVLLQLGDDVWSVSGPQNDERFDDLLDAMDALDESITPTTRIDYHDSLEELQDEADLDDREHLFPASPDGMWKVGGIGGIWVPARAEDNHEAVFDAIGVYGKHGYFVHLYRWNKQYLYYYDNGWEDRKVGWEVLGKITRKAAISAARDEASDLWDATGLTDDDLADYEADF